jgi:hypothetical protein
MSEAGIKKWTEELYGDSSNETTPGAEAWLEDLDAVDHEHAEGDVTDGVRNWLLELERA